MTDFIEHHRGRFGVEPICRVMDFNPSTYYAARDRAPSARARRDEHLKDEIARVHAENYGVYGVRKVWRQLAQSAQAERPFHGKPNGDSASSRTPRSEATRLPC